MAAFACTIGPATATNNGKRIPCDMCNKKAVSWGSLLTHYNKEHGFAFAAMSGHYISEQATAEIMAKERHTMTAAEFAMVCPVDDVAQFKCKACDNVKAMSKQSAAEHFTNPKKHGYAKDVVKEWVVVKDASALRNRRPHKCMLTSCHNAFANELGDLRRRILCGCVRRRPTG